MAEEVLGNKDVQAEASHEEAFVSVAGIIRESIVDGPGIRFVIFAQGCPHHCKGCHNPKTHPFEGGKKVSVSRLLELIRANPMVRGVTFSGGEPSCQSDGFSHLARVLKKEGYHITLYSGYTLEELLERSEAEGSLRSLLDTIDILVDGPFVIEKRDLTLRYRGSKNQRVLDMEKSLKEGKAVEMLVE